jgi:tetratricopeptide (TPR) repeat protein
MGYEIEDEVIRRYLLGHLAEDERQQLEEKIMVDNELFNRVLLAEDEMVEEYLQGELSERDREGFEASFLATPEGSKQVSFAKALSKYVSTASAREGQEIVDKPARASKISRPVWWRRPALVPYFRLAAAAVIVVGLGLGIWRVFFYQSEVSKGIAALAQAYREQRPLEARISGFNYAPAANTRGEQGKTDQVALDRAERILLDAVFEHPGPASHHALGRLYLAQQQFDKAIAQFEEALKTDPNNAQLHSDYGAALIEKGKADQSKGDAGKSLEEFAMSLEHLNRAIELDRSLLEALFNRALSHEYLMLPQQAKEDWQMYIEKDANSKWAEEARRKLQELEVQNNKVTLTKEQLYQEFVSAYHEGNRSSAWEALSRSRVRIGNSIVEKLMDDYLERSPEASSPQAKDKLGALLYAGDLEFEKVGDRFTLDLAQFYEEVNPRQQAILKRARELVKTGQIQIAQSDFKSAFETYGLAKRAFDEVGNKCESKSAEYWLAICYVQQIDPQQGPSRFRQIAEDSEKNHYKWLIIRSSNALANYNLILNEYSKAISYCSRSRALAEQIGDTYGLIIALSDLIKAYSSLGNHSQTFGCLHKLLSSASDKSVESIQLCLCFARTAWTLYSQGLLAAALDYQKAALESALDLDELTMICTSYVHLGMIYAKSNSFDEALSNVQRAMETANARSDERAGSLMIAYSALHLGSIYRQIGNLPTAIANYNQSVQLYTRLDFPAFIHEAHKGLVLSSIASGDNASAAEELGKAIGYYEDHRTRIWDQSNRNTFFDLENDIYDIAIDF